MAIKKILNFPDARLRTKAAEVKEFGQPMRELAQDMLETMYDAPGIGLAANQVGVLKRIVVLDCSDKEDPPEPLVLINPIVVWASEDEAIHEEGCLSFPNQFAEVPRPTAVKVKFQDLEGNWRTVSFDGLSARCSQHEIDHLNGVLFIDRTFPVKRRVIVAKMNKLHRHKSVS